MDYDKYYINKSNLIFGLGLLLVVIISFFVVQPLIMHAGKVGNNVTVKGTVYEINGDKIIVAYEPIWAIGTGKTATKEDANTTIMQIRKKLAEMYGQNEANGVIIQYGGSVKSSNAKELFEMSDIDGGLVGGASLKAEEFSKIVNFE